MTRPITVELVAVVVALGGAAGTEPRVLTAPGGDLPARAFDPDEHPTMERALRDWVATETGLALAYVEQLYTFGDGARRRGAEAHRVSIGYLAIVPPAEGRTGSWARWARFFPWEDRRDGVPPLLAEALAPALAAWAPEAGARERVALAFGLDGAAWRDELVLERYELLYEARLVAEAWRDRGEEVPATLPPSGDALPRDHRRILATGIGRLRAKLKYRPVLFELMPEAFTLTDLQRAAEAVSGQRLHTQNFRRMVTQSGLVEPTGATSRRRGGRPALEYRFAAGADWEVRVAPVRFGGARRT
ncbi:MAG: NAD regulator [Pseudomonadota bacterium]